MISCAGKAGTLRQTITDSTASPHNLCACVCVLYQRVWKCTFIHWKPYTCNSCLLHVGVCVCENVHKCVLVRVLTVFSDTERCIVGWQISLVQLFIRPRWVMADTCLSHAEQLAWKLMFHISDHLFLLHCSKAAWAGMEKIVFVLRHACVFFLHVCLCNCFFSPPFESYKHGREWLKCIMIFCCFWVVFFNQSCSRKNKQTLKHKFLKVLKRTSKY